MNKLTSLIRRTPKRMTAVVAMVAAAIIVPAAVMAFGPDRPTFTMDDPSDHVALDSITDNPNVGDERNFVGIRPDTGDNGVNNVWTATQTVTPGQDYLVRMYVHNNAATNLNLVAKNVTASFNLPTTTAKSIQVDGFLSTSNWGANNSGDAGSYYQIYDSAVFNSDQDFNLAYVPGSAKYENNSVGANGGVALSDNLFTNAGDLLGYDKLDGNIPGCLQYAGYVTFEVKPQFATPTTNFTVTKDVRKAGTNAFVSTLAVNPGDALNYRVTYTNTGTAQQNAVVLKDTMPKGVTFTPGSVAIMNASNPNGAYVKDGDNLFTTGINIGNYTGGSDALVVYNATVDNGSTLTCGADTLVNTASAQPSGLTAESGSATVTTTYNGSDCSTPVCTTNCTTTPPELPHTGPTTTILGIAGLGAIVASLGYFITSRRALAKAKNL